MRIYLILICILLISCKENPEPSESNLQAELEYEVLSDLGEGAIWNYETRELFWVDIIKKRVHIYNPSTQTNRFFETPSAVGTVVPSTQNKAVVALEDGIYMLDTNTGAIESLSDIERDMPENRFNDGKCDPLGNFWVGSMHYPQSEPNASLYRVSPDGSAKRMIDSVTISNGIVWTKDSKTMYYIDTPTAAIKAYDFDPVTAEISNERIAVRVSPEDGHPDGMAIDSNDQLWVGLWNGNAVAHFDPLTGKLIKKVMVPAHNVTSCAFGGDKLDILYITTSSLDMTDEEKQRFPLAGSIFKVKPGVNGVKSSFFKKKNVE